MRNLFRYRLWMTIEPEARYKIESFSTKGEKVTARACVKDVKYEYKKINQPKKNYN